LRLELTDGSIVLARTVVFASGARYRRPNIPDIESLKGAGVTYWASAVEAKLCEGENVTPVRGGNSAGHAAVCLAPKVRPLHLVVLGPGLEATMSRYLIDRIKAQPNIELVADTEMTRLDADESGALHTIAWRNRRTGEASERPMRHLFLFIGADPCTDWMKGCDASIDDKGFLLTGPPARPGVIAASTLSLQTSLDGVFAIGDVRSGSTKRVAAAVGEGAAVVAQIHGYLASHPVNAPSERIPA
jgi:thioredoxin reductase (NADPH)